MNNKIINNLNKPYMKNNDRSFDQNTIRFISDSTLHESNLYNVGSGQENSIFNRYVSKSNFPSKVASPMISQWSNGVYNYNYNFTKNIPAADNLVDKLIKGFFTSGDILSNPQKKRLSFTKRRFKRLSLNNVLTAKPTIKHNADKVYITIKLFNKKLNSISRKLSQVYETITLRNTTMSSKYSSNTATRPNITSNKVKNLRFRIGKFKKYLNIHNLQNEHIFFISHMKQLRPLLKNKSLRITKNHVREFSIKQSHLKKRVISNTYNPTNPNTLHVIKNTLHGLNEKTPNSFFRMKRSFHKSRILLMAKKRFLTYKMLKSQAKTYIVNTHAQLKNENLKNTSYSSTNKLSLNRSKLNHYFTDLNRYKILSKQKSKSAPANKVRFFINNISRNSSIYKLRSLYKLFSLYYCRNSYVSKSRKLNYTSLYYGRMRLYAYKLVKLYNINRLNLKHISYSENKKHKTILRSNVKLKNDIDKIKRFANFLNSWENTSIIKYVSSAYSYSNDINKFKIKNFSNNNKRKQNITTFVSETFKRYYSTHTFNPNIEKNNLNINNMPNKIEVNKVSAVKNNKIFNDGSKPLNSNVSAVSLRNNRFVTRYKKSLRLEKNLHLTMANNTKVLKKRIIRDIGNTLDEFWRERDLIRPNVNFTLNPEFKSNPITKLTHEHILDYICKAFSKEVTYISYIRQLAYNDMLFKKGFLNPMLNLISKIYNKKVVLNIVSLKYIHLNSDILMEAIATKLRNSKKNRLNKVLRKVLKVVAMSKVNKYAFSPNYNVNKYITDHYNNFKKLNYSVFSSEFSKGLKKGYLLTDRGSDKFQSKTNISNINSSNILPPYKSFKPYGFKWLNGMHANSINFITHKVTTGIKLETSGRLTKRSTASRAIFKIKNKGSLKNKPVITRTNSVILIGNERISNLQYSKVSSTTRNGSFGVKGWINNN